MDHWKQDGRIEKKSYDSRDHLGSRMAFWEIVLIKGIKGRLSDDRIYVQGLDKTEVEARAFIIAKSLNETHSQG